MKRIEKLFGVSIAVISLTTLITTIAGFFDFSLPRWARWTIGIVNTVSLPLMIYSTVQSLREKARAAKALAKKASGKAVEVKLPLEKAAPSGEEAPAPAPVKVKPKPHPKQLAARKAAAGNKPKKGKKKKK